MKNTVIYGEITVFGTPGETRTHYLALRRRTLYPGELREQITLALYRKFLLLSTKRRHIFLPPGHILAKENEGREAVCRGSKAKWIWRIFCSMRTAEVPASAEGNRALETQSTFFIFLFTEYGNSGIICPEIGKKRVKAYEY